MEKVNFYHHYVKVKLKGGKSNEQKKDARKQLLVRLLLNNKICLSEINQKLRIDNPILYIAALRVAREKNFIDDYIYILYGLNADIGACESSVQKEYLQTILENYVNLNPFDLTFYNKNINIDKIDKQKCEL